MSSQQEQSEHGLGLSALVDGEATADEVKALCKVWKDKDGARQDWHLYHLIGDTLRSDELAQTPNHDRKFLERLSERLAHEPVVLAPYPAVTDGQGQALRSIRKHWLGLSAVAAGFALVAGALLVLQNNAVWEQQTDGAGQLAQANASVEERVVASAGKNEMVQPVAGRDQTQVDQSSGKTGERIELASSVSSTNRATGQLIRDPRLERYLRAHKEYGAGAGLGMSTGYLRNASFDAQQP